MRLILRHPLFVFFMCCLAVVVYLVIDKANERSEQAGNFGMNQGSATLVSVAQVSRELLADRVESVATAGANQSVDLTAKVSETVTQIHFQDGQFVEEGDILLELTNREEASRLAEAQASENDARRQFERLQGLADSNLISSNELDTAQTALETAEARLEGVLVAMDDRVIRAPFSGFLGFRNISAGSLVSPGTVITTLDDISTIKLDFTVPERNLASIRPGQTVTAQSIVYEGVSFEGIVDVVSSRVDPVTRSVTVRALVDNPDAVLRRGMLLTVSMETNARETLVVPEQSVVVDQGRQYVFVVDENYITRRTEVTLGQRRPGIVEIISGLLAGQMVVTEGIAQVREGQRVEISGEAVGPS